VLKFRCGDLLQQSMLWEFSERYDIGGIRDKYFNFKRLGKRWILLWRHCQRKNTVRTILNSQSCHGL
jgi:hypothetical protein